MSQTTQTLPARITAGLNFQVCLGLPQHPAPDWAARLYIRGADTIDLQATPAGTDHVFAAPASTTKDWTPGTYWYAIRAQSGDDLVQIETGAFEIEPDLTQAPAGYDGRTPAQIALDNIDAVLQRRATVDQERYRINNRELYRTPIADLIALRGYYARQVAREKAAERGQRSRFGRSVTVRFSE